MTEQGVVHLGGQPKQTYYTPDGRKIMALPDMHTYERRNEKGQTIESGVRDVNFDRGWLPQPPQVKKPYCPHCDKWHDSPTEVIQCGEKKGAIISKATKVAEVELGIISDTRIDKLESDMSEIKDMFKKLLEKM
jgi:hypothetical protein